MNDPKAKAAGLFIYMCPVRRHLALTFFEILKDYLFHLTV